MHCLLSRMPACLDLVDKMPGRWAKLSTTPLLQIYAAPQGPQATPVTYQDRYAMFKSLMIPEVVAEILRAQTHQPIRSTFACRGLQSSSGVWLVTCLQAFCASTMLCCSSQSVALIFGAAIDRAKWSHKSGARALHSHALVGASGFARTAGSWP